VPAPSPRDKHLIFRGVHTRGRQSAPLPHRGFGQLLHLGSIRVCKGQRLLLEHSPVRPERSRHERRHGAQKSILRTCRLETVQQALSRRGGPGLVDGYLPSSQSQWNWRRLHTRQRVPLVYLCLEYRRLESGHTFALRFTSQITKMDG
jgi:hypothetical protein